MPTPVKVKWISIVVTAALIGALIAWFGAKYIGGGGKPAPGDIIIVHPEPNDPNSVQSAHWFVEDFPDPQYEAPTSPNLNSNAFPNVWEYWIRTKRNDGTWVKITEPTELRGKFGHCSDWSINSTEIYGCTQDSDCTHAANLTCIESSFRLTWTPGPPKQFHWWLKPTPNSSEIELTSHPYANSKAWRGELCGRLIGNLEVTYNNNNYVISPLGQAWIQAATP